MKLEDKACIKMIEEGKIGQVTFIRYSLVLGDYTHYKNVLSEFYDWVKNMGVTDIESISASQLKNNSGILVTGKFKEQVMFNLYLAKDTTEKGFVKKVEVSGTDGLYVFNSESEEAFMSTCISKKAYDFVEVNPVNNDWLELIDNELQSKEVKQ